MAYVMRHLQISVAVEAQIDGTWNSMEEQDWLLIEDEALANLNADLAAKTNLFSLPILQETLPKYIGFEQTQIDHAVFDAAFCVLGRPGFEVYQETLDSLLPCFNDTIEDPMLAEIEYPASSCANSPRFSCRLRLALAWSHSGNELANATNDADDVLLRGVELPIPRPPSSPLLPVFPRAGRRRLNALRLHALS